MAPIFNLSRIVEPTRVLGLSSPRTFRNSVLAAALVALASSANAQHTLTAYAVANHFSLATYATNIPTVAGSGPLGVGFREDGGVLVTTSTG